MGFIFNTNSITPGSGSGSGDAVWGSITGTLADQTDLATALAGKQDTLTAGTGIDITNNVISATGGGSATATSVENKNTAVGATNPLNLWEGTSAEYETGGGSQTWYNWQSGGGLSFNYVTTTGVTDSFNGVAYGNGKFIICRYSGASDGASILISDDNGQTWDKQVIETPSGQGTITFKGIAYGNNTWVINGTTDKSLVSTDDGQTWNVVTSQDSGTHSFLTFGNNKFVALTRQNGTNTFIYSADNGQTWSSSSMPSIDGNSGVNWRGLTFGNNKFYAVANSVAGGAVSSDGTTWTTFTMPSNNYSGIAYGNGLLVASINATTNNIVYSNDDGQTWNTASIPLNTAASCVTFGNNQFVVISAGSSSVTKQVAYSSDAINWTVSDLSITKQGHPYCCFGQSNFVCFSAGYYTSANIIGYSTGGQSSEVFTTDSAPTTSSQVYSAPNTTSALTITSVGTGTITLSDTNTYDYNASGNQTTTQSVGEAHPDWICLIEGVGIKKGSTTIA